MITAVDSSVLLDVFGADPRFGPRSREALRKAISEGSLSACDVVWAEVSGFFPSVTAAKTAMEQLGLAFDAIEIQAAFAAGHAWKAYGARGGRRDRVIADFLIGAHALHQADRLLTRDRGYYRSYFRKLRILDPAA